TRGRSSATPKLDTGVARLASSHWCLWVRRASVTSGSTNGFAAQRLEVDHAVTGRLLRRQKSAQNPLPRRVKPAPNGRSTGGPGKGLGTRTQPEDGPASGELPTATEATPAYSGNKLTALAASPPTETLGGPKLHKRHGQRIPSSEVLAGCPA